MILVKVHEHDHSMALRIEAFPCVIGRSMTCAIRIDDPSVSARHAELTRDGERYVLRDLGSTNGVVRAGAKVQEVRLVANETVYLGEVRVELLIDENLPKTKMNQLTPGDVNQARTSPWLVVLSLVLGYGAACAGPLVDRYAVAWPPERPRELVSAVLGAALPYWAAIVGAAFLISLFCKLNSKRFQYHRVLNVLILAGTCVKALEVLAPTLAFNAHYLPLSVWILPGGYGVVAFGCFFVLQRYAFRRWRGRRRALVALALTTVTLGLVEVTVDHRSGPGERDRMADLGYPLHSPQALRQTPDDLIFDIALSIAETDERRIRVLERLEAERDAE